MKILLINVCCNGSTGHIAQDIANEYLKKGDEAVLAYGRGKPPKNIKYYKIGNKFGVYLHALLTRLFDRHGFYSTHATKKFIKWIEKYNPDLIWLHNIHGYYLNVKILFNYLRNSNKKVMWTLHDCWAMTGHCSHFMSYACEKWKTCCKKCQAKHDYPSCVFFSNPKKNYLEKKKLFTSIDINNMKIITPSLWLANIVKKSFLKKYDVEVINNKIDLNIFKPTSSTIKERFDIVDKKVILGVASVWTEKKGLNDFIELSKILSNDYKIVLIGLNDKQIKKMPKNILGIKRTESQKELAEWYSAAYCFFDPTYEDNYPTVLLEAKACGCKTISYDTGGCSEISDYIINNHREILKYI